VICSGKFVGGELKPFFEEGFFKWKGVTKLEMKGGQNTIVGKHDLKIGKHGLKLGCKIEVLISPFSSCISSLFLLHLL
jgi:hypothetical protein